jgi:hypothetical protein
VHIEDGRTIGEKRNFGSGLAHDGDLIASWDDDDWSDVGRLGDQVARLQKSGKAVTGYHSMLFTDGVGWWRYRGSADYALGTSLCYTKAWWDGHRFPPKQVFEDGDFVRAANIAGQLVSVDAGLNMVATIHNGNTSPRQLWMDSYTKVGRPDGIMYE